VTQDKEDAIVARADQTDLTSDQPQPDIDDLGLDDDTALSAGSPTLDDDLDLGLVLDDEPEPDDGLALALGDEAEPDDDEPDPADELSLVDDPDGDADLTLDDDLSLGGDSDDLGLDGKADGPAHDDAADAVVLAAGPAAPAPSLVGLTSSDDTDLDNIEIHLDFGGDDDSAEAGLDLNLDFGEDEAPAEPEAALKLDDSEDIAAAIRTELRAELADKDGEWYVVHTYSGMEKRVKSNLDSRVKTLNMEDYIFEAVVPTEDVVEIRSGQKKTVTRTVVPGYVLVRMELTDESWAAVRHTPSVTGFVGHANDPVPLSLDEVVEMLLPSAIAAQTAIEGSKASRRKKVEVVDFHIGDSVVLTDGAFTGVNATITEIDTQNHRLKVTFEFMGRETPVEIPIDQVQKI